MPGIKKNRFFNYEQYNQAIANVNLQNNAARAKKKKILCVDDSTYNLFVIKELLI